MNLASRLGRLGHLGTAVLLSLGLPAAASAHPISFATANLRLRQDGTVRGAVHTGGHVQNFALTISDARGPCPALPGHRASMGDGLLAVAWRCRPGAPPWVLRATGMAQDGRVHVRWRLDPSAPPHTAVLEAGGTLRIGQPAGAESPASASWRGYLAMGVEHILAGADHLAFVLLLTMLAAGLRQLFWTVTAFTVGHSVTLAIAALGAAPPSAPVEALVALSLVMAAREAVRRGHRGLLGRRPPLASGGFGLLHGLAFAGALREVGLPRGGAVPALLGFNLGVELGQLLFVGAVVLGLRLVAACSFRRRCRDRPAAPTTATLWPPQLDRGRRLVAAALGVWAALLFFERASLVTGQPPVASASPQTLGQRTADGEAQAADRGRRTADGEAQSADGGPQAADETPDPFAVPVSHSTSIGSPRAGRLEGAIALPMRGAGFRYNPRKDPAHRHGTVEVVRAVVRALGAVARELPGGLAWVGEISSLRGGPLRGHRTHQAGRDVDISFFLLDAHGRPREPVVTFFDEDGRAVDFGDLEDPADDVPLRLDVPRTWHLVQALLHTPDPDAQVQRILLAAHLHDLLRAEAERSGAPAWLLDRFEQVSCQPRSAPHDDHLHVRFYCAAEDIPLGCADDLPWFPWHVAALRTRGLRPRRIRPPPRAPRAKVRSVAEARAAAGPMDAQVVRWLDRREQWMRQGSRRRPCLARPASLAPRHAL